jgi:hypothetical protein
VIGGAPAALARRRDWPYLNMTSGGDAVAWAQRSFST